MQFKKYVVVGVLITLYLSTDSLCHYIPENKTAQPKEKESSTQNDKIQICGNALTTMIIEACEGILGWPSQANYHQRSVQTKITEDCCNRECPLHYLQSYCGETPLFSIQKVLRGNSLAKIGGRSPAAESRSFPASERHQNLTGTKNNKKIAQTEVSIRQKTNNGRKGKKGWKKRKRSFKWKCAFNSFGHYLLKLDRNVRVKNNISKRHNNINRTWPSIQIGTVSPEIDKFGGQPIVMVKKTKSNSI